MIGLKGSRYTPELGEKQRLTIFQWKYSEDALLLDPEGFFLKLH